ncbi:MAG TPA: serine/threonine-protein kinase, partial [Polyangiaceae bacterium]
MATCPTCGLRYPDGTEACAADGAELLPDEAFASVDPELEEGTLVGDYRLEGRLGQGGFGTVHRAVHSVIGKVAAVKILHREYSSNPQMVSRFIAEARAVNQIRHKNIIDIFAFGRIEDGRHYFVMELLEGESLEDLLYREGRLSVEQTLKLLRPVARALDAAHAAGIAHRDLKPDNVFLATDEEGQVVPKLLDFGIAKLLDATSSGHRTATGTPIGTPHYMSPEQCRGLQVGDRTDVYSFGVMMYRVLTGVVPFDARTTFDIMSKHINEPPPTASEVCSGLPASLDAPIAAMLAKEPAERPPSLESALDGVVAVAVAAGFAVEPVSISRGAPSGSAVRVITGSGEKRRTPTFANARTVQAASGAKTLGASERDVKGEAPKRSRAVLLSILVLLLGAGGAGAVFFMRRAEESPKPVPSHSESVDITALLPSVAASAPRPLETQPAAPAASVAEKMDPVGVRITG